MKKLITPLALLALAACGSSEEEAPPPTGAELVEIASTPFSIGETVPEDRINPTNQGRMTQNTTATLEQMVEAPSDDETSVDPT